MLMRITTLYSSGWILAPNKNLWYSDLIILGTRMSVFLQVPLAILMCSQGWEWLLYMPAFQGFFSIVFFEMGKTNKNKVDLYLLVSDRDQITSQFLN